MKNKLTSRKLWLTIVAALLPIICQVFMPEMPSEKIVISIVGILGGVWGIAKEDVEKIKAGVKPDESSPLPEANQDAES